MSKLYVETPWDIAPNNTSIYQILEPDDQYLLGNGIEPIQKYDGDQFVNLDGGAPLGNILAVYKDRLMVAGDEDHKHRIWFSHIRNGEGWTKDTDWIEIKPEDGGRINGMDVQGDELIISKSNGRLYGWQIFDDGDPTNSRVRLIEDDKGMVNQKASTVLDDVFYYLDRSRIDTNPQVGPGGLSNIIEEVIQGIKSFAKRALGSNDGNVYVGLGDTTIDVGDEVDLNNAVAVFDTTTQAFYLLDNIDAVVFTKFIDGEVESLYFGDSLGRVYKIGVGTLAGADPIHMRIRTKPYFRELGQNVHIKAVGIYMDDPDATVVTYRTNLNQAFTKPLGTVIEEPVQWFDVNTTGPLLQLEFTHSNSKARPRLLGIDIEYDLRGKHE